MPLTIRPFGRFPVQDPVTYNSGPFLKLPLVYTSLFGLLITLLLLSSGPAYGEWVWIDKDAQAGSTLYVDFDTIRRKGDLVKLWALYDIDTVKADSPLSFKELREFDCTEERHRLLAGSVYSEHMGKGNVVQSISETSTWYPVEPDSIPQKLWKAACSKP
jgi:hypothetical protein